AAASTTQADVAEGLKSRNNIEAAARVGRAIAEKAKAAGIDSVAFDRSGYRYHGRIKALADAAREAGLQFRLKGWGTVPARATCRCGLHRTPPGFCPGRRSTVPNHNHKRPGAVHPSTAQAATTWQKNAPRAVVTATATARKSTTA